MRLKRLRRTGLKSKPRYTAVDRVQLSGTCCQPAKEEEKQRVNNKYPDRLGEYVHEVFTLCGEVPLEAADQPA